MNKNIFSETTSTNTFPDSYYDDTNDQQAEINERELPDCFIVLPEYKYDVGASYEGSVQSDSPTFPRSATSPHNSERSSPRYEASASPTRTSRRESGSIRNSEKSRTNSRSTEQKMSHRQSDEEHGDSASQNPTSEDYIASSQKSKSSSARYEDGASHEKTPSGGSGAVRSSNQSRANSPEGQTSSNQQSNQEENNNNPCWSPYSVLKLIFLFLATFILLWFMIRVYATINNEAVIIKPLLKQSGSNRNRKNGQFQQRGFSGSGQIPNREQQGFKQTKGMPQKLQSKAGMGKDELVPAHRMLFDMDSARELHDNFCSKSKDCPKKCTKFNNDCE